MRKGKTSNVSTEDLHTSIQIDMKTNTLWTSVTHLIKEGHIGEGSGQMGWEWVSWNEILQSMMIVPYKEEMGRYVATCSLSDICT